MNNPEYSLTSRRSVKRLLADRHRIAAARGSDTVASDILLDLHAAIDTADLTDRQAEAIAIVYGMDTSQSVAARIMGVSQPAVAILIDSAAAKIRDAYLRKGEGAGSKQ